MGKVTLDLPSELEQALGQISQRSGRSREDVVREALDAYVQQQESLTQQHDGVLLGKRRLPRSIGMIEDGQLRAEDIDDWLEANWRPQ